MAEREKKYRIFLSAAEPSGDGHCAGLIGALKKTGLKIEFAGVGGDKMEAAGCRMLAKPTEKAAMAYKAFGKVAGFYKLIRRLRSFFKEQKIDMVIVCDSPAFNFHIAKAAKDNGIKTVFYVAPQLWAWGGWRLEKLKKCCDKLCCILPFEENWFAEKGIDTTFVGNPLLDELAGDLADNKRSYSNFEPAGARIALLPGSRAAEINSLWQPMQRIAVELRRRFGGVCFVAAAVDEKGKEVLKSMQVLGFRCDYRTGAVFETARGSDFALVASGSAALQVAAAGCPMVIMYQTSRVLWHLLGRWLIKTKYLSLVNILAARQLVPEFMPYFTSIEPIIEKCSRLLADEKELAKISGELVDLAETLHQAGAAERTAGIVTEML